MQEIVETKKLLTPKEVAARLACSVGPVRNMIIGGRLPAIRFGIDDRVVRVKAEDVDLFIEMNTHLA
ncbi:MAG: excisionase family DNA-binding protein [Thermoguttaceae bacterium]